MSGRNGESTEYKKLNEIVYDPSEIIRRGSCSRSTFIVNLSQSHARFSWYYTGGAFAFSVPSPQPVPVYTIAWWARTWSMIR
jgi:hypothetical protein